MKIGDVVFVFDPTLWMFRDNPKDDYFRKATILNIRHIHTGEKIADIRFHHNNKKSLGHFISLMKLES